MYCKNYTFCKIQNVMKEARLARLDKESLPTNRGCGICVDVAGGEHGLLL